MTSGNLINELRDTIQDCNINFLIGSGLSMPYLSLLGKTERLLTELSDKKEKEEIEENLEKIIKASLYKAFFDGIISKNINLLEGSDDEKLDEVLNNYQEFIKIINTIFLNRRNTILSKQINLFTTNFDIFLERTLEVTSVEYNDGFSGRFNPVFNLSNFKKSFFKRTLHYDNTYELPVFNLMKIHGSLTWEKEIGEQNIYFDKHLQIVRNIKEVQISDNQLIDIEAVEKEKLDNSRIQIDHFIPCAKDKKLDENIERFIKEYEKLSIINPTKEKFKETVLNRNHYELLRIYSTELEKENTVLFVMGFSFSDEHIREVTIRVANSNPTLKIYVFAYTEKAKKNIERKIEKTRLNNDNVQIISPSDFNNNEIKDGKLKFQAINEKVFNVLLRSIDEKEYSSYSI
ncbi:MAG: SIR2 family protein [Bdellovibrionales bacterium]|nr:SIR2 family protein [Bdellovibrionales bacterium]